MASVDVSDTSASVSKETRLLSAASAALSPMPEHIRELESRRLEGLASLREWEGVREASAGSWAERVDELRSQLGKVMTNGVKETHDACVFLEKRIEADLGYAQSLEGLPDDPSNWNEYSRRTGKLLHDFNEATQTTLIDKGLKEVEVEYKGRMDEILTKLDSIIAECQASEVAVSTAWKEHEGMFMSRFTHGAEAGAADRWSSERNYRKAVDLAAEKRSVVEGRLVSSVAAVNKAEAWREQNTNSVVRHWLTKQYQLWLHVSSAAQDQQRVLTEELTEAALTATGALSVSVGAADFVRIRTTRLGCRIENISKEGLNASISQKGRHRLTKDNNCYEPRDGVPHANAWSSTTSEKRITCRGGEKEGYYSLKGQSFWGLQIIIDNSSIGSSSQGQKADSDHAEAMLVHRPFFHQLRDESQKAGGNLAIASPGTGLVIHSAKVSALPSSKSGGWFSGGPKWTIQRATVTADAYLYLQDEHQDDVKPISALLTQSTVTLATEGDSEVLTVKPEKQSGMFSSAPKSLQLKFPKDAQHLGGRWLELLHRVQCQARNREELLATTAGKKPSKARGKGGRSHGNDKDEAGSKEQDRQDV
ncbi:Ankyrin Repeat [Perkinsus chesapeaki]|uniref:Ankyrin Repeat n=1 Tax=Perkinsus chesapeaki TaxID=330153 RepID=A0A7J6MU98_PERCH|nr:Ankyrin Repeat [Perkinsus chesapeaki]